MLSIELSGYESPGILRAVMTALHTYVDAATQESITSQAQFDRAMTGEPFDTMPNALPPEPTVAADVPAAAAAEVVAIEKPTRRKRTPAAEEVKAESAETATADQSAVIAEAQAQIAEATARRAAEGQLGAPGVTVAEIRAVAKLFNTDELRTVALAILEKHEVGSVTALGERDNLIRVSALADFQAAATQHNLS